MKKVHGFTLIEIIVVVAVVGLLSSLAGLVVTRSIRNARRTTAETELEMIASAVLQLAWDTGKWPNGASRIDGVDDFNEVWDLRRSGLVKQQINVGGTSVDFGDNWKGPYYKASFEDPWWKDTDERRENVYYFDSDYRHDGVNRVVVGSCGPNGIGRNRYDSDNIWVAVDKGTPQSSAED